MSDILTDLIRANLALAVGVAAVMLLRRPVARRLGARAAYMLWAVPPLAALASLLPARTVVMIAPDAAPAPGMAPPLRASASIEAPLASAAAASIDLAALAVGVWLAGVALSLCVLAVQQGRFHRTLGRLTRESDVFRAAAEGVGPALVGILWPRIVVPADFERRFSPAERAVMIAHEQAHLRAGDPLVNALAAACQCLCWFNPLVHLAVRRLRIDQELACDAAVMARHPGARKPYAEAMLKTQGVSWAAPLACAWRSHPIKERIAMLKAARPSAAARLAGSALAAGLAAFGGLAAWAAQPPQVETVSSAAPARTAGASPSPALRAERGEKASRYLGRRLVAALDRADHEAAVELIEAGADVNHFTPGEGTPLIQAIRHDDIGAARRLIANGADVNQRAPGEGSALIVAAKQQKLQFVELLVEAGADVNGFVLGDETPLINASRSSDLRIVRYLVERGADPSLAVPTGNFPGQMRSPLSVSQDPAVTAYLRSRGARR